MTPDLVERLDAEAFALGGRRNGPLIREAVDYVRELQRLWDYAKSQADRWRFIAAEMGYEPKAHKHDTFPAWLNERIAKFRREAAADEIERLSATPAQDDEPVAWMYEHPSHPKGRPPSTVGFARVEGPLGEGWTETPLYTRPQATPAPVDADLREASDTAIPIKFDGELIDSIAQAALDASGREQGPPCPNCRKPVEVGQVILPWDDAEEMHADCEHPFSLKFERHEDEPDPVVLLGEPMRYVPLSSIAAAPQSGEGE